MKYSDIKNNNVSSIVDKDGWVLAPFKNNMCRTHTDSVYFRWCNWKAGEIRNQTEIGRDYDWCEAVFLIKGEMFVKYESESILLSNMVIMQFTIRFVTRNLKFYVIALRLFYDGKAITKENDTETFLITPNTIKIGL